MVHRVLGAMASLMLVGALALADEASEADDVRQIEAEVAAYVEAFNAKDAAELARHWSEAGAYVRPADGMRLVGRKAIEKEFRSTFASRSRRLPRSRSQP